MILCSYTEDSLCVDWRESIMKDFEEEVEILREKLKAMHRRAQKAEAELAQLKARGGNAVVDRERQQQFNDSDRMMEAIAKVVRSR
jgi:fructose/tagatose bisphosphate aldolase